LADISNVANINTETYRNQYLTPNTLSKAVKQIVAELITTSMRYNFSEIFRENSNGSISPLMRIRVGGVTLGEGIEMSAGVAFGGVDFYQFKGHEIEADQDGEILVIKAIY